jgi:hypothetical protein
MCAGRRRRAAARARQARKLARTLAADRLGGARGCAEEARERAGADAWLSAGAAAVKRPALQGGAGPAQAARAPLLPLARLDFRACSSAHS